MTSVQPASRTSSGRTRSGAPRGRYHLVYLAAWRQCARFTMAALAEHAGINEVTVWLAEHGRTQQNAATVQAIAAALDIPMDILLSYPPTAEEARQYMLDMTYRALAPVGAPSA